jgi:hypothetical protein
MSRLPKILVEALDHSSREMIDAALKCATYVEHLAALAVVVALAAAAAAGVGGGVESAQDLTCVGCVCCHEEGE